VYLYNVTNTITDLACQLRNVRRDVFPCIPAVLPGVYTGIVFIFLVSHIHAMPVGKVYIIVRNIAVICFSFLLFCYTMYKRFTGKVCLHTCIYM
jgi:hypothetical protein